MELINDIDTSKYLNQKLPLTQKGKKWFRANMDEGIRTSTFDGLLMNSKDAVHINLAKGDVNTDDFKYVTNPHGLDNKSFPAELFNFNIIKGKKRLLYGEKTKRPFQFSVIASNEETYNEAKNVEKELLVSNLEKQLVNILQNKGAVPSELDQNGQPIQQEVQTPEQIKKFMRRHWKSDLEIMGQRSLNNAKRSTNLQSKFLEGFSRFLDTNKSVYYLANIANEPTVRNVNTCYFYAELSPDNPWVEDAASALELRFLTVPEVIDEFYDKLKDDDVEKIDRYRRNNGSIPQTDTYRTGVQYVEKAQFNNTSTSSSLIPVFHRVWKTLTKIGELTYIDEYGYPKKDFVDESFKITQPAVKDASGVLLEGQEVRWLWINDLWEGVKIGEDIYLDYGAAKSYYRNIDNPSRIKLPYIGYYSNDPSLVEDMKPYQYFYIVLLWRLQNAFASDKGKVMLMDISQIPASKGWNLKRWMYYLDAMKIAFVDPYSEGHIKRHGKAANFNQFQSIDMTLGNQIDKYILMLDKIDGLLGEMTGLTRQRQGQISSMETVGGVERSVMQSNHITEYYFEIQNQVENRVLSALLDVTKDCNKEGKKIHSFDEDGNRMYFEVDGLKYSYTQFDVWVSNSAKDVAKLSELKQIVKEMSVAGKALLSDVATVIMSESIAEVTETIKQSEADTMERQGQAEQARLDFDNKKAAQDLKMKERELGLQEEGLRITERNNIRDNETKLILDDRRELSELSKDNGNVDIIKERELALKERTQRHKEEVDRRKIEDADKFNERKLALEAKKINLSSQRSSN